MRARKGMKHLADSFCVSLCLTLAWGAVAFANPCARDIAALCPNVPAGEGHIAACLRTDALALSSACSQHLEKLQAQLRDVRDAQRACEDDICLFCTGVQPGEGGIAQCLTANAARLSPACKRALSEHLQ